MKLNHLLLLLILFFYESAVKAAPQAEKPGKLSPETEMAIMRVMNLENRIQTLQTVPVKMTNNPLARHFSGTWICFTTMRLNGQLGRGIMEIRLEQDGDELVGEGGQLKHPFDPPGTIRPIGTRSAAVSDFIGQFKKAPKGRHNMVVLERQQVDGPTWATFTAVMAGDGRTARGTLVNAGGNYGLMFMVRREFLSDFKHLLTEEGRDAEAKLRWIGIEKLELVLDTESMDKARIDWWKRDRNRDGKLHYSEFQHPDWKRANRNNDDIVDWAEEVSDRVLKKLVQDGDFLEKHGNDSQAQWPSIYAWGVAHPGFEQIFYFIDWDRDGKITSAEYTAFEDQLSTYDNADPHIAQMEAAFSKEKLTKAREMWAALDKNRDNIWQYDEFPHPDWKRANRDGDDGLSWKEELADQMLRRQSKTYPKKYGSTTPKEWSTQEAWNKDRPDFQQLFAFIDWDHDGVITVTEYEVFDVQIKSYTDGSWPKTNEQGESGMEVFKRLAAQPPKAGQAQKAGQSRKVSWNSQEEWNREKPNIIVIMADDLGYSDLSCYGGEIETPNIDRLAEEGLRFTGFKNTARCAPSRATLLTGRYQHSVGVGRMTANDFKRPGYRGQLSMEAPTLAEIFKSHGYGTGMVGKWHLTVHDKSSKQKRLYPCDRGFDHFYGTWWGAKDYFKPQFMMKNHQLIDGNTKYPDDFYLTHALSASAIEFVESQNDQKKPFFLYLAHYAPHAPIQAPEDRIRKCLERYKPGFVQLQQARFERQKKLGVAPKNAVLRDQAGSWKKLDAQQKNNWMRTMATYAAMIEIMDDGIGQLIDVLKKNGQYENTLIVFLSDNGSTPERKNVGAHLCASLSNTPFSGFKAQTLEGGISSPFIFSWPKKMAKYGGQIRNGHCHIIDVLPTCLEATGVSFPDSFNNIIPKKPDGVSLMDTVEGKELEKRSFFWEHGRSCAVYKDGWKLVAHRQPWKLFDLNNDPVEQADLSKEYPENVASLKALWEKWGRKYDVIPFPGSKKKRQIK